MTDQELLVLLKTDLQLSATAYDELLLNCIASARTRIEQVGITINSESVDDEMLVESYAAFMFRLRKDTNTKMPRSLDYALKNRLWSEKANG